MSVALPGGNTALLLALKNKHVQVARTLLQAGADPRVSSAGLSVFSQAAYLGEAGLIRQLLKQGLDPNFLAAKRGDLPLASALFAKQSEVVRILLAAGANPNAPGRGGTTPLEIAIQGGFMEAVKLLLHHGADVNHRAARGMTPLMQAVGAGQGSLVPVLLDRGAGVNERSDRGKTALDLAREQAENGGKTEAPAGSEAFGLGPAARVQLYELIMARLREAGGKFSSEFPPDPGSKRGGKGSKPLKSPRAKALAGARDLLELVRYTEPEFAVVAVKAPLEKVARALAEFRQVEEWVRDVPRRHAAGRDRTSRSVMALVKLDRNRWTIVLRSIFRIRDNDYALAVEDARELSARLKTNAVSFVREKAAESVGYDLFEKGRASEHAQWIEENSFCWFKSRFQRKPGPDELGEDFVDRVLRQQGIYLPACYATSKPGQAWLNVERVSFKAVVRADLLMLPARRRAGKR